MENDLPGPHPPLTYGIFHMFRHFFFESFPYCDSVWECEVLNSNHSGHSMLEIVENQKGDEAAVCKCVTDIGSIPLYHSLQVLSI